jgi:L-methionine (R)-S-oxide reductase
VTVHQIDFPALGDRVCRAISEAEDSANAMETTVNELNEFCPHYDWVGIYLLNGEYLDLGPFRGEPSPHTHIPLNQGICGAAAAAKETVNIPDVNADPRYLACSLKTRSEIVVPIMDGETCLGEIDIDSHSPDAFTDQDRIMLERIAGELANKIRRGTHR